MDGTAKLAGTGGVAGAPPGWGHLGHDQLADEDSDVLEAEIDDFPIQPKPPGQHIQLAMLNLKDKKLWHYHNLIPRPMN